MSGRRRFLGSAAGLVVGGALPGMARAGSVVMAATNPEHPDAILLTACAEFIALEAQSNATFNEWDSDDPREIAAELVRDRICGEQDRPLYIIDTTPALTIAGLQAKARCLMADDLDAMVDDPSDRSSLIRTALLRDLLEMGMASA